MACIAAILADALPSVENYVFDARTSYDCVAQKRVTSVGREMLSKVLQAISFPLWYRGQIPPQALPDHASAIVLPCPCILPRLANSSVVLSFRPFQWY